MTPKTIDMSVMVLPSEASMPFRFSSRPSTMLAMMKPTPSMSP